MVSTNADATEISLSLRRVLRLASSHRWVAEWLFEDSSSPFHSAPTLPPHFRSCSFGIQAQNTVSLPSTKENPLPFSTRTCRMLFVPIAETEDIITGYSLDCGDRFEDKRLPPPAPFDPPFFSRFAFHTINHDLLIVTMPGHCSLTGIIAMNNGPNNTRNQSIFTVPAQEYSFQCLPSVVLAMYSNTEYRLSPTSDDGSVQPNHAPEPRQRDTIEGQNPSPEHHASGGAVADFQPKESNQDTSKISAISGQLLDHPQEIDACLFNSLPDSDEFFNLYGNLSMEGTCCSPALALGLEDNLFSCTSPSTSQVPSNMPWFFSPTGTSADGLSPSFYTNDVDTSCGSFSASRLSSGISKLLTKLSGEYFGPFVRLDMLHVVTGNYMTTFTGNITYTIKELEGTSISALERTFANGYYLAALSVTPDQRLIHDVQVAATVKMANEHFDARSKIDLEAQRMNNETEVQDQTVCNYSEKALILPEEHYAPPSRFADSRSTKVDLLESRPSGDCANTVRPIAPAPLKVVPLCKPGSAEDEKPVFLESKEERQKRILDGRKKRNRLSAARSNIRRREQTEAMSKEIQRNRKLAEDLARRKHSIVTENERLKDLITKQSA